MLFILLTNQVAVAGNAASTLGCAYEGSNVFVGQMVFEGANFVVPGVGVNPQVIVRMHQDFKTREIMRNLRSEKYSQFAPACDMPANCTPTAEIDPKACDSIKEDRDSSRSTCFKLCGLSALLAYGAGAACKNPLAGLTGLIPGFFAVAPCNKWEKHEKALEKCENDLLDKKKERYKEVKAKHEKLKSINEVYGGMIAEERIQLKKNIENLVQEFKNEGRNLKNPEVQEELRKQADELTKSSNERVAQIEKERQNAINAL